MAPRIEPASPASTIFIIDDDEGMRRALTLLLNTVGYRTASYSDPEEFLAHFRKDAAGCLVLDIRMPGMSGLELQHHLNRVGSALPVIFITGHADVPMAVRAMKEGAFEFIQKPFRDQDLLDCINHALRQNAQSRASSVLRADIAQRFESLTSREHQVMSMVVEGAANKVIAIDLGLSERTVEIHRAKVMEKMAARSVAHLVRLELILSNSR